METQVLSENILLYKQNGFYFEKQASDFQIPLAYFVGFFPPVLLYVCKKKKRGKTLLLASCTQLLLYAY